MWKWALHRAARYSESHAPRAKLVTDHKKRPEEQRGGGVGGLGRGRSLRQLIHNHARSLLLRRVFMFTAVPNFKETRGQWPYRRAASKPQMSNLASDLTSVTSITYISMCILFILLLLVALRPLQPLTSLRGQI